MKYKKILLKLSGESFCKENDKGIAPEIVSQIASSLKEIHDKDVQLAVVVGGGNLLRGASLSQQGMERDSADYMGMLCTLVNALALQSALEQLEVPTRVQTAIITQQVAEPYIRRRAIRHLEKGRVVILAGGAGIPRFTTDTVSVLRAKELGMDLLVKATKVDGVYTEDPLKNPNAARFHSLSYDDAINKKLRVMDATAFTLAEENSVQMLVLNIKNTGSLLQAISGNSIGTLIGSFKTKMA